MRDGFLHNFGHTGIWWLAVLLALAAAVVFELAVTSLRRIFFPKDQDLWQEIERYGGMDEILEDHANDPGRRPPSADPADDAGVAAAAAAPAGGITLQSPRRRMSSRLSRESGRGRRTGDQGRHSDVRSGDEFYSPVAPFTPPAEEREDPLGRPAGRKGGPWIATDRAVDDEPALVQSPVELRGPWAAK